MSALPTVRSGAEYVHYKGGRYTVVATAIDATNTAGDRQVVVYRALKDGAVYVRNLAEFLEPVVWPDGETRPRFLSADTR